MTFHEIITDPDFLELVGAILVALWTWAKANKWLGKRNQTKVSEAIRQIELAVMKVHTAYTQTILEGRKDGKLTAREKTDAEQQAIRIAKQLLAEKGIEIYKLIAPSALPLLVRKAVNSLLH
jgi:hypothetical protein